MSAVYPDHEATLVPHHNHLLCWKSVFAGLLIALMGMLLMTSLGAAIGGFTAEGMVAQEEGGMALATGAGLYLGLSIVAVLFCGAYFAVRLSRFRTTRIGAAHGMVIAALFFGLAMSGLGKVASGVSQAVGKLSQGAANGADGLAQNPMIQDAVQKALGGANLKSDPNQVAQGLVARLSSGDTESAKDYLAYQTGQSKADVDAKVTQLKSDFEEKSKIIAEKAAKGVGESGLAMFLIFFVGLVAATVGGRVATRMNVDRPFAK